ncbi:MAG: hypothetical protein C4542_04965 [Dehalococcoidia bacterium]|nr:MAG: hypothetical protein C4542_04965 [Dehalococcoidia bacterium]
MDKIAPLVLGLFAMYVEDKFLTEVFKTFGLILQGNFVGNWLVFILQLIFAIATPFGIIAVFRSAFSNE